MKITFDQWLGIAPKFDDEMLGEGYAVQSHNSIVDRGILEGFYGYQSVGESVPSNTVSLFRYLDTYWFTGNSDVAFTDAAIANDGKEYVVITDSSYPKYTSIEMAVASPPYPTSAKRLGVPTPTQSPSFQENVANPNLPAEYTTDTAGEAVTSFVYYAVTFVDTNGFEGAALPSTNTAGFNIQEWRGYMVAFPRIQWGRSSYPQNTLNQLSKVRFYRSVPSLDGQGVFLFVGEIDATQDYFEDQVPTDAAGEAMITQDWVGPPDDDANLYPNGPMRNALAHPAGFIVGHTTHDLIFSEPFTIHAYPTSYRQSLDEQIVGICLYGNDLFVGTKGAPRIYTGLHPSSMSPIRLPESLPLANPDAMVEVAGRLCYASRVGLVEVIGTQQRVISRAYFTEQQWRNLEPETMRLAEYQGRLVIFTANTDTYMLDFNQPDAGLTTIGVRAKAFYNDPNKADLYYTDTTASTQVRSLGRNTSTRSNLTYKSRIVKTPSEINFPFIKVRATAYPVTVRVYGMNDEIPTQFVEVTLNSSQFGYLGLKGRFNRWQIELGGNVSIKSVELSTSPGELS